MGKDELERYLKRRAIRGPWRLQGDTGDGFSGCVVIPALAESQRLFATLESLAANPEELVQRFLVVVVVNHREDASPWEKADNLATLSRLSELATPLRLAYVDAAAVGLELPAHSGGVGLARRIGMDLALPRLGRDGVLVCLDADTLVEPGYLEAIRDHFATGCAGGAVIPFSHQPAATVVEQRAIELYELYLRHYVLGLEQAGSPYAFHCVGSAMACTVKGYLAVGGITPRRAGEDFYFLQQLHKTVGVAKVRGTTVHPSSRSSHRVPFGTGKSISRILAEGEESQSFYRPECFRVLHDWLSLVEENLSLPGCELVSRSAGTDTELGFFLAGSGFGRAWDSILHNTRGRHNLLNAFHGWFDSLKTVRLVHHLSSRYPRCAAQAAIPELLGVSGITAPDGEMKQLALLREMQNGGIAAAQKLQLPRLSFPERS
jgi:glycosyltransferase involved in cell wall biosynthesis